MSWSTTTRYESTVADGGLALVQDLMNTIPAGRPRATDLLQDVGTAQGWAESALADWAEGARGAGPPRAPGARGGGGARTSGAWSAVPSRRRRRPSCAPPRSACPSAPTAGRT